MIFCGAGRDGERDLFETARDVGHVAEEQQRVAAVRAAQVRDGGRADGDADAHAGALLLVEGGGDGGGAEDRAAGGGRAVGRGGEGEDAVAAGLDELQAVLGEEAVYDAADAAHPGEHLGGGEPGAGGGVAHDVHKHYEGLVVADLIVDAHAGGGRDRDGSFGFGGRVGDVWGFAKLDKDELHYCIGEAVYGDTHFFMSPVAPFRVNIRGSGVIFLVCAQAGVAALRDGD